MMQERAQRYVARMAGVTHKVLPHLETMLPAEILGRADQVDKYDRVARRNYGLDNVAGGTGTLNVAVLAGGRAVVRVVKSKSGNR
jgi:hypothetical protein